MFLATLHGERPVRAPRHLDAVNRPADVARTNTGHLVTLVAAWFVKHAQMCKLSARDCHSHHPAPRYLQAMMYEISYRLGGIRAMESVRIRVAQFTLAVTRRGGGRGVESEERDYLARLDRILKGANCGTV